MCHCVGYRGLGEECRAGLAVLEREKKGKDAVAVAGRGWRLKKGLVLVLEEGAGACA